MEDTLVSSRFRFEPGSYAGPDCFLPFIACFEQHAPGQWRHRFVLVIPDMVLESEEPVVVRAEQHLEQAFQGAPSLTAIAGRRRAYGYVSVEEFRTP